GELVENGAVYRILHCGFAQAARDLEADLCSVLDKDDSLRTKLFGLLQGAQLAGSLDPVILAELLVNAEVTSGLAEHGVGNGGQQCLLLGGEVYRVNGIQVIG